MSHSFLQFHVHVIEGRHLKSRDESKSSDPFVAVHILGEVEHSHIIYDSMNCTWDKSFFFEFNDISISTVDTGKVSFIVYDSNTWKRNTIIGSYDMDIAHILENKVYKQWIVLSDPSDTYEGIQGFLSVSVSAIKEGETVQYENRIDELKSNDLLVPHNVKKEEYVFICVLHCVDYDVEDNIFVYLQFNNGQRCCSSIINDTKNPVYNQELHLPIVFPSMSDLVEVSIVSKNNLLETVLCTKFISISSLSRRRENLPLWYHFSKDSGCEMYVASMLAHMYLQKVDTAKLNVYDIVPNESMATGNLVKVTSDEKQQHMLIIPRPYFHECVITCNMYECHNIHNNLLSKTKASIEIWYKNQNMSSTPKYIEKDNRISWYEKISSLFVIEKAIQNQDNVYVYLKRDDEYIGFHKIKLEDVVDVCQPKWIKLCDSHILMSMLVYKKTQIPKRDPFIQSKIVPFDCHIDIHQGLFEKYGDYQVEMVMHDKSCKSSFIKQSSLCDWFETHKVTIHIHEHKSLMPLLYLHLYESNKLIDSIFLNVYKDIENKTEFHFPKAKATLFATIELTGQNMRLPVTLKTIRDTYITRVVLLGLRNFTASLLCKKIRFGICMNESVEFTNTLSYNQNANIMQIFDFIVNQYAKHQYIVINIEDVTIYNSKLGECVLKIEKEMGEPSVDDSSDDEVERDDIPRYLQHRQLLRCELEKCLKTKQPFAQWDVKNKHNKSIGHLLGYTRRFEKDDTQRQMVSHENEQQVFKNEKVVVRVYILRCMNLIAKDVTGSSDPYVELKIGNQTQKTKIIEQNLNPEFHEMIEFKNIYIPKDGYVNINVYDWDLTSADDFIGSTYIDITNRWYHDEWNEYAHKPLEIRTLHHPNASGPQGVIELWVDILTNHDAKVCKPIDISLPPPKPFVVRLIIWNAKKLACNDMNNMNDLYISGILNDNKQCTDIHWRSSNRRGNFNYRLLWDIELPMKKLYSKLTIQAWDQDIIGESDLIGEGVVDMYTLFKQAYDTLLPQRLQNNERDVWVELFHADHPSISRGFVRISLEVVTKFYATQHPAGEGRNAPNINPTLQEPIRPSFQITRPLEMIADLLGEEMYTKLKLVFYVFCFCGPFFTCLWLWVQIKHAFGIKYSWE